MRGHRDHNFSRMANKLQTPTPTLDIAVESFGTTLATSQKFRIATVEVETKSSELIPISVLSVPSIAAPILNVVPTPSILCHTYET